MSYYFLYSSFPPLESDREPGISRDVLENDLALNLNARDQKEVGVIRRLIDVQNTYALLVDGRWHTSGSFSTKGELEDCLMNKEGLPEYILHFFEKYQNVEDQRNLFTKVFIDFFRTELAFPHTRFVSAFLHFERSLRLVLTAYRCKKWGGDLLKELQFEDMSDSLIIDILVRKDAPQYEFPPEFKELRGVLEKAGRDPLKQHFAIEKYRFRYYSSFEEIEPFSLDSILAYFVQHMILVDYYGLEEETGKDILAHILET